MLQFVKDNVEVLALIVSVIVAVGGYIAWRQRKRDSDSGISQRSGKNSTNVIAGGDVSIGDRDR